MRPHNHEAGDWQGADSPTHAPRYAAIAEILHSFSAARSVLDVGCGEAELRAWLPKDASYIGIEPSGAAVQIATERNPSGDGLFQTLVVRKWFAPSARCAIEHGGVVDKPDARL